MVAAACGSAQGAGRISAAPPQRVTAATDPFVQPHPTARRAGSATDALATEAPRPSRSRSTTASAEATDGVLETAPVAGRERLHRHRREPYVL